MNAVQTPQTNAARKRADVTIDTVFAFHMASEVMRNQDDDSEPHTINDAQARPDWPKWKEAIEAELRFLKERQVFSKVTECPTDVKPVGHRWVFVRKRDANGNVARYKARLVAQGFTQRFGIDYDSTYSPVMDAVQFRYLIGIAVEFNLVMRLMDVVTAYLYALLDVKLYMNASTDLQIPCVLRRPVVMLKRALYGLKQLGRMWYNRLRTYMIDSGFIHTELCPSLYVKRSDKGFVIQYFCR